MQLILGADHGGFELKESLKGFLKSKGFDVLDEGAHKLDPADDFVEFAFSVAKKVSAAENKQPFQEDVKGILLCRSAAGMVIAANKVKGIRAVSAVDEQSAVHSRLHNAANILALSGDGTDEIAARKIITSWANTSFSNEERHRRRLLKIAKFES